MTKIFIEAEKKETPECAFLKAILNIYFPEKNVDFICIGGIDKLFNETNVNQMHQALADGEQVLILVDADTLAKGYGCKKRSADIDSALLKLNISVPYFIYPNNKDDGEVEMLMESTVRRDLHKLFFDCFEGYEKCVSRNTNYNTPNLKGKLHTYITAQKLSNKLRRKLGVGDWLFNEKKYWNLDVDELKPLKEFLTINLK